MRLLYVFPHPDDESFGPGAAMAQQLRQGHEVFLLVLTRGGATRVRHELGLSIEEMGALRAGEMECVARVYGLTEMTILDLPDGRLKELDPRQIEATVAEQVERIRPGVIVTYPAHGVSGFEDHLVTHAVVKRVFCELRERGNGHSKRLAFTTLAEVDEDGERPIRLRAAKPGEIDCTVEVSAEDLAIQRRALDCYETYQEIIRSMDPASLYAGGVHFEIFQEEHDPPLADLIEELPQIRLGGLGAGPRLE